MLLVFYSGVNFSVKPQIGTLITCCYALLLFGNILIFYAFNKYSEELYLNMEHQILITKQQADLSYFTKVAEQQEDHNEFIHNTTHYLRIINKFAQMHDFNSIIEIVGELDNHMVQSEMILYSNHHVLNAILSEQKQKAEENNICFDAYVEPGIVLDMVENIDLIVMLGNLLDNAMRAAKGCKENPYIQVRIYMQEIGGFCVIKVVNNFSNEIKEKEGKILTTKKEEGTHGLGIGSVQKTAEKYGGFLSCKYEDSVFEAVLLLSTDVK